LYAKANIEQFEKQRIQTKEERQKEKRLFA
jgi:hypothetical protein